MVFIEFFFFFTLLRLFSFSLIPISNTIKGSIIQTFWCGTTKHPILLLLTDKGLVYRSPDIGKTFENLSKSMIKSLEKTKNKPKNVNSPYFNIFP